jgi:glycosyltransferase involved in cell wall biosynthesis
MNSDQNERKLYILVTSDEPNNVILGHASFAKKAGLEPVFVFPFRKQSHDPISYSEYKVLRMKFIFSTDGVYKYIISIMKFIYYTTKIINSSNSKVLAIDLTGVIAAVILKLKGNKIYALVNDNFSARYKMPVELFLLLRWMEGKTYAILANVCIFPSKSRYEILGTPKLKKIEYLPNILSDNYVPKWIGSSGDDLEVMLCGWLVQSRGLDMLNEIISYTDPRVKFILMGSGDEQAIKYLCKNDRIIYIAHGSRNEALSKMSKIDINLALYNPEILINRYALPQKIYDALMIGCPLFVNSEVQMAEELRANELCLSANYKSAKDIANILNNYVINKENLKNMSRRILKYSGENLSYSSVTKQGVAIYTMIAKQ